MKKDPLLFVMALLGLIVAPAAESQTVTLVFQNGVRGYQGQQDCFVLTEMPDANTNYTNHPRGRKYEIEWGREIDGGVGYALIQFQDIIGDRFNQIPPGSTILNAEVQTIITDAGTLSESSSIHNLLVPWDERTATFASLFPAHDSHSTLEEERYISETKVTVRHQPGNLNETWRGVITPLVQEFADGLPNHGFIIIPDENTDNLFAHYSSETPLSNPELVLTVQTPNRIYRFQQGVDGYAGVRDSWIGNSEGQLAMRNGTKRSLSLRRRSEENVELGLLRFDHIIGEGAGQIPAGETIEKATLTLWISEGGDDKVYLCEILPFSTEIFGVQVNTYFQEYEVTFENFVENGVYPQPGVEVVNEPCAEFIPTPNSTVQVDVTSSLQRWVGGELENYGWLLEAGGSDLVSVSSKEAQGLRTGPPRLVVTFQPPASVADFLLH